MNRRLICFLICLTAVSCNNKELLVEYHILNKTSKTIEIIAFSKSRLVDAVTIEPSSTLKRVKDLADPINRNSTLFFNHNHEEIIDSVSIIQDRALYKIQFCDEGRPVAGCDLENNIDQIMSAGLYNNKVVGILGRTRYSKPITVAFEQSYFDDALELNFLF